VPVLYIKYRDECYKSKRKNGKLSEKDKKDCKKWAAIRYYKKTGKAPVHADVDMFMMHIEEILKGR
jgi:hypothetical protein